MPTISKKNKTVPDSDHQIIRPEFVARGKLLAQDPNYPDRKIIRNIAKKLVAEAITE